MATIPRSFIMMNSIDEVTDDESSMASGCDNEVESVLSIQGYENHFLGCADEMKLPESFNIVADESQRTCVIIYYDCVVGMSHAYFYSICLLLLSLLRVVTY